MAINPEIALGFRPPQLAPLPQIQSPLDRYQKMLTLRHLMQQGQLGQMNIEQTGLENEALREKQRRITAVADLFKNGRPPEDQMLAVGGPEAAAAIKALHDADQAKFTVLESTTKAIARAAQGVKAVTPDKRDFAYRAARSQLAAINPALAAQMPEQYPGDSWLDQKTAESLSAEQYLTNVRADAKFALEQPELAAKSLGAQMAFAAQTAPNNQADWDVWRAGLSPGLQQRIPAMFSPVARQMVQNMGLTREQQAVAERASAQASAPNKPPALMPPDVEQQQTRLRMAGAPRFPSPGMTPEAEAQTIRIDAARADAQPATEAENRSLGFYDRSASADKTLEGVKDYISNKSTVGMWLTQTAPNSVLSKEEQSYMQGARQFINAYLRRDSGAAIQPSEWDEAYKTFLPYPGDKPETLALKARERKVIIEGLKISAGRAHSRKYGAPDATPTKQGGPTPPARSTSPTALHTIEINGKFYQYKGSGATDDLSNYTEVKP